MGLIDRLAKALADQIEKAAPNLPAGAVTMTEQQMQQASQNNSYQTTPLPRNPQMGNIPFAPGLPITPGAINPIGPDGRAAPRRYEYQVAQNINVATEQKLVPFKTLRAAADQIDIVRRCIEVLKSKITGLDWDITIAEDAAEKIIAEIGGDHVRAMAVAREKFSDEIYRARTFWENPDKANGLTFIDWLMIALEEIIVLDAWAIWPQRTVGGDLYGLQILDGSTIKPLLDDRGMRPMPPQAAYQQILYGFPRSEFTATSEDPEADGEFTSDDLAYLVRNRRATSVYGNGPVERCLPVADLYLRRQQWLRAEYTDGVLPELMFKVDPNFGNDPILLQQLENALNDDLSGQTEQRKRSRVLPAGFDPVQFDGYGERFKEVLDTYLVTSICGHFGVMPTEIGFSGHGGLGNSGHQAGEQQSAQQIGVGPMVTWLSRMLTNLSYTYLGMPRELEFKFMIDAGRDNKDEAARADLEMRGATRTINERRSELGLPLLDTPAADQPMLVAGNSVFLFSPDGIINVTTATGEPPSVDNLTTESPIAPVQDKPTPPAPIQVAPGQAAPGQTAPGEEKPNTPAEKPGETSQSKDESDGLKSEDTSKAGVPSKSEVKDALSRLKILPNAAGAAPTSDDPNELQDTVESPWPIIPTESGSYPVSPDVWEKAELTLVNVKELYATDTSLDRSSVADHIQAMGQALTPYRNYPLVYQDDDKQIIIDGHHRLFAMWLLGMDQVPVWLGTPEMSKAVVKEVQAFFNWTKRKSRVTPFQFKSLDPIVGEALNRCYFDGDMETAKSLARAYLT